MQFYEAGVADILRCCQRDNTAITELQEYIQSVLKLFAGNEFHVLRKHVPNLAAAWYYLMTSVSNLQTLGEEYTGTIRFVENGNIPSRLSQLIWLVLHIGGEPLLERLMTYLHKKISHSTELELNAKLFLEKCLNFIKEHKDTVMKIHHSLFYINGKYYNLSNRTLGIRYVLLRQWLQNNTFAQGFKILGNLSLFYILINFVQKMWTGIRQEEEKCREEKELQMSSNKMCVLCCENRRYSSVTPCGHIYCWDCIYDSLSFKDHCPLCREPIRPSRIVLLQNYM